MHNSNGPDAQLGNWSSQSDHLCVEAARGKPVHFRNSVRLDCEKEREELHCPVVNLFPGEGLSGNSPRWIWADPDRFLVAVSTTTVAAWHGQCYQA
jgi:hypothetical protein